MIISSYDSNIVNYAAWGAVLRHVLRGRIPSLARPARNQVHFGARWLGGELAVQGWLDILGNLT